ncbi:MAG: LUD domain-containing protein [Dehalococcoidia bacterium]|nr:LUD domain-containing protein [Dehalococcoidia bacterium]MDD5494527.1 LUD domain-containing protein [Dehalococcoidia bacterium]
MAVNPEYIERYKKEAARVGSKIFVAATAEEAVNYILALVKEKNIQTVVKSDSALAAGIGLREQLENNGVRVIETSIVQWIRQLSGGREAPLDEIAASISSATGEKIEPKPEAILKAARRVLKDTYANAGLGITQADFGIAESGTLVSLENEGNARLAAALPHIHLTLLDGNCIVANLAEAAERIKNTAGGIPGHKVPTFITYLTGRNTTGDIPGALFARAQGPEEEHILILALQ